MRYRIIKGISVLMLVMGILAAVYGVVQAGSLEPSAAPGPTMKTLNEIPPTWSQILPASERFELVMGGAAVLDKETGLVWEKSPSTATYGWYSAVSMCYSKTVGGRKGWRLPTVEELTSLMDPTQFNPVLPSGHPFTNVQSTYGSSYYWTSTTSSANYDYAYTVGFGGSGETFGPGGKDPIYNTNLNFWCVRGGHGHDGY